MTETTNVPVMGSYYQHVNGELFRAAQPMYALDGEFAGVLFVNFAGIEFFVDALELSEYDHKETTAEVVEAFGAVPGAFPYTDVNTENGNGI